MARRFAPLFSFLLLATLPLAATNGLLQVGPGVKTRAMGGAGIAYPQDSFASAVNPAGLARIGGRADLGLTALRHSGHVRLTLDANGTREDGASHTTLWWPEIGWSQRVFCRHTLGLATFFAGQWDVDYGRPLSPYGNGFLYSDYKQLYITPSWAWQVNCVHAVGIALNAAVTWLRFNGLENFIADSLVPNAVTDRGIDREAGLSIRFGWLGHPVPCLWLGLTYQTPTWTSRYRRYRGFLPNGDLELPAQLGFGLAWQASPATVVAFDAIKIFWRDSKGFLNDFSAANADRFGASDGPGFAWDDQLVLRLGINWQTCRWLAVRIGYNHGNTVLGSSDGFLNVINMQGIENMLTLGATLCLPRAFELNLLYLHGFRHTVSGPSFPLPIVDLVSRQNAVGFSIGRNY